MLPFLEIALKLGIPVLVMNPNFNRHPITGRSIPYNTTMTQHAKWVWGKYVKPSGFDQINIVAHSAGGACLGAIMQSYGITFWQ